MTEEKPTCDLLNAGESAVNKRDSSPVTRSFLVRTGASYLQRYNPSVSGLRRYLKGKALVQSGVLLGPSDDPDETERRVQYQEKIDRWIEEILEEFQKTGYLDDYALTLGRARGLIEQGQSRRMIAQKLQKKGINSALIERVFEELDEELEENPEQKAIVSYARKRRLAAFAEEEAGGWQKQAKQKAALSRRGFSYETIEWLYAQSLEEIEGE